MSNILWFSGLAVICIGIAAYAIYKKRDKYKLSTYLVFYMFTASITWIGEFVVLGLFSSYAYKPGLIENPWAQNIIGHLFLNASMFPATATVMVAYSLRYGYMAIAAVIYVVVEYVFVKQGLYIQHWWRYYMSAVNVVAFLIISRFWFSKINKGCSGLTRAITFYFVAFIIIHFATPLLLLAGKQHYQLGLVKNFVTDFYLISTYVAFVHHLIICGVHVFFVCVLKKWYWKIGPYIITIITLTIYAKMHVLIMDNGWKLIYYILIQLSCLTVFILIEKHTLIPNEK